MPSPTGLSEPIKGGNVHDDHDLSTILAVLTVSCGPASCSNHEDSIPFPPINSGQIPFCYVCFTRESESRRVNTPTVMEGFACRR
jgi:hypothetical protein